MGRLKERDDFGNRMKAYESVETDRQLNEHLPIYARIDGRAFSKFTKHLLRPYDPFLSSAMIETTKFLVDKTAARCGYTQSDEISLVWLSDSEESSIFFKGKVQKLVSILASMTSSYFMLELMKREMHPTLTEKVPHFDCRVCQLPSKTEATNMFLWRAMDAKKNAISMVAQAHFSHKQLHKVSDKQKLAMLREHGIEMSDFPNFFRYGTLLKRHIIEKVVPELPVPTVIRHEVRPINLSVPFNEYTYLDREEIIFGLPYNIIGERQSGAASKES